MSDLSQHSEWLSLIEVSGPFLAEPVLKDAFPQGLEGLNGAKKKLVRQAYDEWREAIDLDDPDALKIHKAWIELVLRQGLELDEDGAGDVLKRGADLPELKCERPEHGVTLTPDFAVVDGQGGPPLMLVTVYEPQVVLSEALKQGTWSASPGERMVELCRATGVRLGLVTNGEQWMFVDAPVGAMTTFANWYGRLWAQEPITLQAFVSLLGIRRFFVDRGEQLPALLDNSLKYQDEVTDALGEQVRRAVEVLIQALDRAHVDSNRTLLEGVEPAELYEAGLTVMMRIVFLLSAEERGLLLLGDELYEANYAVSTLRLQLRSESEEILERRWDAWSRLLSLFRAVYGGIDHEALRLPALGGSLFDPDRFPFLEGRPRGSRWKVDMARPLPIDNRTVLLLLEAVQLFRGRTLSYMALDVEQIGYVYEGLLERTVVRAAEVTLDLDATKSARNPWVTLPEIEDAAAQGQQELEKLFKERTESSASRVRNDLNKPVDDDAAEKLLTACHADRGLRDRVKPYFHFLRTDPWGYPLVYPKGTFMVASGSDRRETGAHYTPKSLTEAIVKETLEPIVYIGPAEGEPRDQWRLKPPDALLDLKICDPAMGSGAFLVQVCRWLSERLVEAWGQSEAAGKAVTADGIVVEKRNGYEPLRSDPEERLLSAKRLIAERCLYGVDVNPLAVELAKLSIWLVTLAKERPFGFLDHNLRSGDSLLGINNLDQLFYLDVKPNKISTRKLFASQIDEMVAEVVGLRLQLRSRPVRDIRDVEIMTSLDEQARAKLLLPGLISDSLIGEVMAADGKKIDATSLSIEAGNAIAGNRDAVRLLQRRALKGLASDLPAGKTPRKPFHWPLEYPEVFIRENGGFDALVGNPPFLGGTRISGALGGIFRDYIATYVSPCGGGQADLVAYFFVRAESLIRNNGCTGLLSTNSISEGDTRQAGLEPLLRQENLKIITAYPNEVWPGKAAVVTSRVHIYKGEWKGRVLLSGNNVNHISAFLSAMEEWTLQPLEENDGIAFEGTYTFGDGFTLSHDEAQQMISEDERNRDVLFPYINGKDINSSPTQAASRWVVNFFDWPEERAREYSLPYKKILDDVKEHRQTTKNAAVREYPWWLHWRSRPALYHSIGRGSAFQNHPKGWVDVVARADRVLASCRVSKHPIFVFIPNDYVYSNAINVFAVSGFGAFGCLQSSIHASFIWKYASRMKNDLRYTPGDVFMPFPFPIGTDALEKAADDYHAFRAGICAKRNVGLTAIYNAFHDKNNNDVDIRQLRELHKAINHCVVDAYGWRDLSLNHDFHVVDYLPESDSVRFTISELARVEVLRRLSVLNRQRVEQNKVKKNASPTGASLTLASASLAIVSGAPALLGQSELFAYEDDDERSKPNGALS